MAKYFIGIPLSNDVKKKVKIQSWSGLSRYKEEKIVPQSNWYLSLAYVGHLDEEKAAELKALIDNYEWPSSFSLSLKNFGAFPSLEETKILWMGVERGKKEITEFAKELRRQLDQLKITYDDKDFVPHLTLARFRSLKNTSRLKDNGKMKQEIVFEANELCLFDSDQEKNPYHITTQVSLKR
jgi:2'-5' RNA ligase